MAFNVSYLAVISDCFIDTRCHMHYASPSRLMTSNANHLWCHHHCNIALQITSEAPICCVEAIPESSRSSETPFMHGSARLTCQPVNEKANLA